MDLLPYLPPPIRHYLTAETLRLLDQGYIYFNAATVALENAVVDEVIDLQGEQEDLMPHFRESMDGSLKERQDEVTFADSLRTYILALDLNEVKAGPWNSLLPEDPAPHLETIEAYRGL